MQQINLYLQGILCSTFFNTHVDYLALTPREHFFLWSVFMQRPWTCQDWFGKIFHFKMYQRFLFL